MVTVVSAAIVNEKGKRLLLAQRSLNTSYGGLWCTPGGKVEKGETNHDALAHELREEIGFAGCLSPIPVVYSHKMKSTRTGEDVLVVCYRVEWPRKSVPLTIGDKTIGLGWFDVAGLYALYAARRLTPADEANIDTLAALVCP